MKLLALNIKRRTTTLISDVNNANNNKMDPHTEFLVQTIKDH